MVELRAFDAFPKVEKSFRIAGGNFTPTHLIYLFVLVFITYVHTTELMGDVLKQHFDVDPAVKELFPINLSIYLNAPCNTLGMYLDDVASDRMFVNELAQAQTVTLEDGTEVCSLRASFEANRIAGSLNILSLFKGSSVGKSYSKVDTSHYIETLFFGEIRELFNPLERTRHDFSEPTFSTYKLVLIPTRHHVFGLDVDTYQYSVTEWHRPVDGVSVTRPGISFEYDFDPIRVSIYDNRISFFDWSCRAINIVGGFYFAYRALRSMLAKRFGKPNRERYSGGLLDPTVKM